MDRGQKEEEPYMAVIGVSRISGRINLFDSEHTHQHCIALRIKRASRRRDLSSDWIHGEEQVAEVWMSEAQWASFVSSINMGDGVPCTLRWTEGTGSIPLPDDPENRTALHADEILETLEDAVKHLRELQATNLTKAQRGLVSKAIQEICSNVNFVAKSFDEVMEERVQKARAEVDAYMTRLAMRVGLDNLPKLSGPDDTPQIEDRRDDE